MKENVKRVINLTKFFGFSVEWRHIIFVIFLYPALAGSIFGLLNDSLFSGIFSFIVLFSLPGVFLALFGKFIFYRARIKYLFFASGFGSVIYSTLFLIFYYVASLFSIDWVKPASIISGFLSSLIWYFTGAVFFKSPKKALLFAILQFIVYVSALSFFTYYDTSYFNIKFILSAVVFSVAIAFIYYLISLPIKKNFGYSGIEMMRMFFAQWLYRENDLESAFSSLSQKAELDVNMIFFNTNNKISSIFVVPSVHYGPFGMLCSSNFPSVLKKEIKEATAFHSTSTHDLNLANSRESRKLVKLIKDSLKLKKDYSRKFSFSTSQSDDKKARAYLLAFDGNAFVMLTRSPEVTEDIEYSLGYILKEKLKSRFKNAVVVDMHNSEGKDITYFSIHSREGRQYLSAIDNLLKNKLVYKELEFSYTHISKEELSSPSLGGAGISIFSFKWDRPIVLIVVDGNAINQRCKLKIEKTLRTYLKTPYVFVLTTDSHEINTVGGIVNEYQCVGNELQIIKDKAKQCVSSMKKTSAAFLSVPFSTRILGKDFSVELVSTLNSSMAIAKIILPIGLMFSILLSLYIIFAL